jgi:hypothetical protein
MRVLLLWLLGACAVFGADNTLTAEEKQAGWILLFDGSSMNGWRDPAKSPAPSGAWRIDDGCLRTVLRPRVTEDLISEQSFQDFDLTFDWRISPGANTGVKYRMQRLIFVDNTKQQPGPGGFEGMLGRELANPQSDRAKLAPGATGQEYSVAFEMQLIDDERHSDARRGPLYQTGSLYGMIPAAAKAAHEPGQWNTGRIIVRGDRFEHWVNGVKVNEGSLSSQQVRDAASKRWAAAPAIGRMLSEPAPSGRIALQHHGDGVWFRNIKLRRL